MCHICKTRLKEKRLICLHSTILDKEERGGRRPWRSKYRILPSLTALARDSRVNDLQSWHYVCDEPAVGIALTTVPNRPKRHKN
jgi:hypothetical protein